MKFAGFIKHLEQNLQGELPGSRAHLRMTSRSREVYLKQASETGNANLGAVLTLLYPRKGSVYTVLIQRQVYNGVHSGQVSFPGGKKEENDKDLTDTALREAGEEIGINIPDVHILGTLSRLYIPPSNFLVTPVVGYTEIPMIFTPQLTEVADIIEVDLLSLKSGSSIRTGEIEARGRVITAPYFDVEGNKIWGATAMIISELTEII